MIKNYIPVWQMEPCFCVLIFIALFHVLLTFPISRPTNITLAALGKFKISTPSSQGACVHVLHLCTRSPQRERSGSAINTLNVSERGLGLAK